MKLCTLALRSIYTVLRASKRLQYCRAVGLVSSTASSAYRRVAVTAAVIATKSHILCVGETVPWHCFDDSVPARPKEWMQTDHGAFSKQKMSRFATSAEYYRCIHDLYSAMAILVVYYQKKL
jgi:hypothetical protein